MRLRVRRQLEPVEIRRFGLLDFAAALFAVVSSQQQALADHFSQRHFRVDFPVQVPERVAVQAEIGDRIHYFGSAVFLV